MGQRNGQLLGPQAYRQHYDIKCFRPGAAGGLGVGAGLAMPAVVLTATVSAALGIWLLFLIQTLYFVIFEYRQEPTNRLDVDPFDRARMAAEQILSH